jgi:hypothetical protein
MIESDWVEDESLVLRWSGCTTYHLTNCKYVKNTDQELSENHIWDREEADEWYEPCQECLDIVDE